MTARIARLLAFWREDLWRLDLRKVPRWQALALGSARVGIYTARSFGRELGGIRAAGLALMTLLSLVPLLALVFAVANGFGYARTLQEGIAARKQGLPAELQDAITWIEQLVARTNFSAMGAVGTLVLAWAAFSLFINTEEALNRVWKTKRNRPWIRRLTDFVALVVFVPVLVIGSISLSSFLEGADVAGLRRSYAWLDELYTTGLRIVPHVLLWLAFTGIYKLMPSAQVFWRSAIVAGMLAGSTWVLVHRVYLHFQVGVAQANAIYATLAALPLLLIYLQLTWTIVLMGAEVAYGVQHVHELGRDHLEPGQAARRQALRIWVTAETCRRFAAGEGPTTIAMLAESAEITREVAAGLVAELQDEGYLALLEEGDAVLPAQPPDRALQALAAGPPAPARNQPLPG